MPYYDRLSESKATRARPKSAHRVIPARPAPVKSRPSTARPVSADALAIHPGSSGSAPCGRVAIQIRPQSAPIHAAGAYRAAPSPGRARPHSAGTFCSTMRRSRPTSAASSGISPQVFERLTAQRKLYGDPEPLWRRVESKASAPGSEAQRPIRIASPDRLADLAKPRPGPATDAMRQVLPDDATFRPAIGLPWGRCNEKLKLLFRRMYDHDGDDAGPEEEESQETCGHEAAARYCKTCKTLLCPRCFEGVCSVAKSAWEGLRFEEQVTQAYHRGALTGATADVLLRTSKPVAERLYSDFVRRQDEAHKRVARHEALESQALSAHRQELGPGYWRRRQWPRERAKARLRHLATPRPPPDFPTIPYLPRVPPLPSLELLKTSLLGHELVQLTDVATLRSFPGSCGHEEQLTADGAAAVCVHCCSRICQSCLGTTCPAMASRWESLDESERLVLCEESERVSGWQAKIMARALTPVFDRLSRPPGETTLPERIIDEGRRVSTLAKRASAASVPSSRG